MQTKTTMRYYFTPMTMAITEKMEDKKCRWRRGETETAGRDVKWCSYLGKQFGSSSKSKIELLYNPAIPLLGVYPCKMETYTEICTGMFMAAVLTTVPKWKQPKCSSADESMNKLWYLHKGILSGNT